MPGSHSCVKVRSKDHTKKNKKKIMEGASVFSSKTKREFSKRDPFQLDLRKGGHKKENEKETLYSSTYCDAGA